MATLQVRRDRKALVTRIRTGALMFYICGVATVLNAVLYYVNFDVLMPVGLHTVQYWLVENSATIGLPAAAGVALAVLAAAVAAFCGWLARTKKSFWAFSAGTALYVLDVLDTFVPASTASTTASLFSNYDSVIIFVFDLYAAVLMFSGFRALRKLNAIDSELAASGETLSDDDDPVRDMSEAERRQYEEEKKNAKGFFARRQSEQSVVSLNPSAAWPEPAADKKEDGGAEDASGAAGSGEQGEDK